MMRRGPLWLLVLLLCCSLAQAGDDAHQWSSLPGATQKVLKPFEQQWDQLPQERRARLLQGVERWQGMDPEQRKIMAKRFKRWQAMSPEQQLKVREHFKRFRQLPPERREVLKNKYRHFQQMSPQRKEALRERWKNLSPDDRKQFREKRLQRMPRFEGGLPDRRRLPADTGLDRHDPGDIPTLDAPQAIIRDR